MEVKVEGSIYQFESLFKKKVEKVVDLLLELERDLMEMGFDRGVPTGVFNCRGRVVVVNSVDGSCGMSTDPPVFGLSLRIFPFLDSRWKEIGVKKNVGELKE